MSAPSLADKAVSALASVRAIGEKLDSEHPMRHAVRCMKRTAETILEDAMRNAEEIANQAKQLIKDYDDSIAEGTHD